MNVPEKLYKLLERLISDAKSLIAKKEWKDRFEVVDADGARRWANELRLFKSVAGTVVKPWLNELKHDGGRYLWNLHEPLSALETIKYAMDEGLLVTYKELIFSEAFADLHEQGSYLLSEGYHLAAGVIFRAVLEEKLRSLCIKHTCLPKKVRPTISDYNTALYSATPPVYDKTVMHNVTALAAVGNDAAHNKPNLRKEDIERLRDGVSDLLARFSA
jgi:hypothetical protein